MDIVQYSFIQSNTHSVKDGFKINKGHIVFLIFSLFLYIALGYYIPRTNFQYTFGAYALLFGSYLWATKLQLNTYQILLTGSVFRLIFLFAIPELSDDFYRFYWDGTLSNQGISPYELLPSEINIPSLQHVFLKLNSQNYYSVYPGVNQIIYSFCSWIGRDLYSFVFVLHILFIGADVLSFYFLKKLKASNMHLLLFFLNPLIILEFTGNLHFEGFLLTSIIAAVYFSKTNKHFIASIFLGIAVSLKIMPVILIPFFLSRNLKSSLIYMTIPFVVLIATYLPFHHENAVLNIGQSVQLYFGQFEFNSSLYLIFTNTPKWLFKLIIITISGALYLLSWNKKISKQQGISFLFYAYLIFSQSIHPWYILSVFGLISFKSFKTQIVWSFLIFMTYITYQTTPYQQQQLVNIIEYSIVIPLLIFEFHSLYRSNEKSINSLH